MAEHILCIDGGGSKTAAALCDQRGQAVLLPQGPGCNPQDNPDWAQNLQQVLQTAPHPLAHTVIGMPGFGEVPEIDTQVLQVISAALGPDVTVLNDVALACHAAFPEGGGVLLLAGTGAMAMAKKGGQTWRAGGWGPAVGDEGSAFWTGKRVLAHLSQAADGRRPQDGFSDKMAAHMGISLADMSLLGWVNARGHARSEIAALAKQVDALARANSPQAAEILRAAAAALADQARAVARQAGLPEKFKWACAGSVFKAKTVRQGVAASLGTAPVAGAFETLGGGLRVGAKAADWPLTSRFDAALKSLFEKDKI